MVMMTVMTMMTVIKIKLKDGNDYYDEKKDNDNDDDNYESVHDDIDENNFEDESRSPQLLLAVSAAFCSWSS